MLVVTSSVGRLTLGLGSDNAERAQDGGNVFQNLQMSAVFPPPHWSDPLQKCHFNGA